MAPMALDPAPHSLKRSASQADFDIPTAKKQNLGFLKHHTARWDVQTDHRREGRWQDSKTAQDLLTHSLTLALEAVGFAAADAGALQAFRLEVEEYMTHFLASARQSMLSARRARPTAQDFLQALHLNNLTLRSLIPHLNPPVSPSKSQHSLQTEDLNADEEASYRPLTSLFASSSQSHSYIPKHFPHLPDHHTYQSTADFPHQDNDPKTLREKANEQAQLGEQALRKLVAAGSQAAAKRERERKEGQTKTPSLKEQRHKMWLETMASVAGDPEGGTDAMEVDGELKIPGGIENLSSAVNAEKRYWRKPVRL